MGEKRGKINLQSTFIFLCEIKLLDWRAQGERRPAGWHADDAWHSSFLQVSCWLPRVCQQHQ